MCKKRPAVDLYVGIDVSQEACLGRERTRDGNLWHIS
jgi:hypothetical protein